MARSEHFDTLEQAKAAFKDCQPCGEYVTIGKGLAIGGELCSSLNIVYPDGKYRYVGVRTRAEILAMDDLNS